MPAKRKSNPAQLELFQFAPAKVTAITARRAAGGSPPHDSRVSYGVALREIAKTVKAAGEDWPESARERLIAELFSAACEAGRVRFDFGEAA